MKKFIIYIWLILLASSAKGQMPQLSQYMLNSFFINPAVAGTYNEYIVKTSFRYQWIGFGPSAPNTLNISLFGPHQEYNMGYGGYIYSDNTGPTSRNGIMGSYAYNIAIGLDYRLSMGISAGLMQYSIDGSDIVLGNQNDPVMFKNEPIYIPDMNIGAYFYSNNMHAGISSHQLFGNDVKNVFEYTEDSLEHINKLKRHVYLMGGYLFILNRDWSVEPSAIITYSYAQPIQFEISCRAIYLKSIWAGLSWRTGDKLSTFTLLTSYKHERKYEFGIAYDVNISKVDNVGFGSVEVLLGYWFDKIK